MKFVARLGNETAVVAFANACRLAAPGAFSAIARIMNVQMVCNHMFVSEDEKHDVILGGSWNRIKNFIFRYENITLHVSGERGLKETYSIQQKRIVCEMILKQ